MLSNVISYRGYHAQITYDPSADAFHGRVLGMQDVISFYGRTPDELREEMKAAVEDYVAWCEQEGDKPEKSWAGKLTLRPDEDVRRRVLIAAAAQGQSVNAWINQLIDREARKVLADLDDNS
jgi:predicted HicB family RNase H-like nuclease